MRVSDNYLAYFFYSRYYFYEVLFIRVLQDQRCHLNEKESHDEVKGDDVKFASLLAMCNRRGRLS